MGRIIIHLHGKPKDKSLLSLIEQYSKRLEPESVKIIKHPENLSSNEYLEKLKKIVKEGKLILLDLDGKEYNSVEFSELIKTWKLNSEDTHLAIGPAIGFPEHKCPSISLSKMTFTHELAALFLIEQVYRSMQIIRGTKYHK